MSPDSLKKRRYIRFKPDPLDFALIDTDFRHGKFEPSMAGLIIDEAPMGGCGLIVHYTENTLKIGDICAVKLGRLNPLQAKVMWRKELEPSLLRIGFLFLE